MADQIGADVALAAQMRRLIYGQLLSRALCAVAALGIPDTLADGPRTAEYLAEHCGAHPRALRQVLRALVTFGAFVQHEDGTFEIIRWADRAATLPPLPDDEEEAEPVRERAGIAA